MNRGDDENFLTRWSRRKSGVGEDQPAPEADRRGEADLSDDRLPSDTKAVSASQSLPRDEPFDLSSLPSIDAIGPDTDLTPFFRPGVPSELRHAALRRMWVSDPAIRDFVGLQEYDWDFLTGDIPGFGAIGPDVDVRAMAERLLGGGSRAETTATSESPDNSEMPAPASSERSAGTLDGTDQQSVLVRHDENAASQNRVLGASDSSPVSPQQSQGLAEPTTSVRARRHGSALPS